MALTIELPNTPRPGLPARRLAFGVVLAQAGVMLLAALVCLVAGGVSSAISALLGGGIATAGSLAMALFGFRSAADASPVQMLASLFLGEAAKLGVVVLSFVMVLTLIRTSAVAMLLTYAATFLVYWIVLASWLPVFARAAGQLVGRESGQHV